MSEGTGLWICLRPMANLEHVLDYVGFGAYTSSWRGGHSECFAMMLLSVDRPFAA